MPSVFDSFYAGEEVLKATITTDLEPLINDRKQEDFLEAVFSYEDAAGREHKWPIGVKARGKFRRRICDFPPVKMKFDKDALEEAGLNDHNDLKLVTHCMEDPKEGLDNLMREFLAYRLYNVLSPNSYRVQLMKIKYVDSERNMRPVKRYAFIIEDTDEMAERLGGKECDECRNPEPAQMNPYEENTLAVFQYMIGNSDWSLQMARNVKFVEKPSGQLLAVPFDFDFSALVDAPYAIPNHDYGQTAIQNRIFLGMAPRKEVLFRTLGLFEQKKEELYAMVNDQKKLRGAARQYIEAYLNSFFYILENGAEEQLLEAFTPAKFDVPISEPSESDDKEKSGGLNHRP